MRYLLRTATIVTLGALAVLQGCATGPWRVVHDPKIVEPVHPSTLSFENIEHATDNEVGVSIVGLRRVEGGVHVVLAVEIPPDFERTHRWGGRALWHLSFLLDDLTPEGIELLDNTGDSISLRQRDDREINRPRDLFVQYGHNLLGVPDRKDLYIYEARFRTRKTLAEGTCRVRAIPSEFPTRDYGPALNINADQKTFTPAFVPPSPGQD